MKLVDVYTTHSVYFYLHKEFKMLTFKIVTDLIIQFLENLQIYARVWNYRYNMINQNC